MIGILYKVGDCLKLDEKFMKYVKRIVYQILNNENLLRREWHLGKVESVIDTKSLMVFVDGSITSQKVSCNPDITFAANDEVWVLFINGDSKNKFVISKRAI